MSDIVVSATQLDKALFDFVVGRTTLQPNRDIYRGMFPPTAEGTVAALIWRGGVAEGRGGPGNVARPRFQVWIRSDSQDKALAVYQQIRDALLGKYRITVGDQVMFSAEETSFGYIGLNERRQHEYSANYLLATQRLL